MALDALKQRSDRAAKDAESLCFPSIAGRSLRSLGSAPTARGAVAPSGPDGPALPSCSEAVGQTTITADYWPHPLTAAGRETVPAVVPPGATLADLVGDMLPGDIELDAAIDGRAVPRAAWHETLEPSAGTWTFAARAVSTSGAESVSATVRVTLGVQRIGGQRWLVGAGPPAAALGADGDLYLNTDESTIWRKTAGAWAQVADLGGADGDRWFTGAGLPADSLGADGDWYFRTENAGIYLKVAGAWVFQLDIDGADGATWHGGNGPPAPSLGVVGDWYFRTDNGFVYDKTGPAFWNFRHDLTGPQGIAGATWLSGAGAPAAGLGEDGDFYLRTDDSTVWRKADGAWSQVADLSGADGARWFTGAGFPAAALGANGDWYFRTSNAGIYRKVTGAWEFQLDVDGEDGATWHGGSGGPTASLGQRGDWYFRTDNGWVYEKTTATVWTFRRDLTGPQGDAGSAADRGPNVYHYQITLAQFALLQGNPSVLPASLVAIANGATLGDNVHGDWIRFWRPGFNQWWTWIGPSQVWRRAEEWIGAADIAAVRIQAIQGDFRDINVTGTLSAEHIDADVRNVRVLWNHSVGIQIDEDGGSITLSENPAPFDYLEFVMQETNPGVSPYGLASIPVRKIHVGSTYDDDSAIAFGVAVGAGEASGPTWWIRRSSSSSATLVMEATHHSLAGNVHIVTGVKEVD